MTAAATTVSGHLVVTVLDPALIPPLDDVTDLYAPHGIGQDDDTTCHACKVRVGLPVVSDGDGIDYPQARWTAVVTRAGGRVLLCEDDAMPLLAVLGAS